MAFGAKVFENEYYDSVFLMRLAKNLSDEPGVEQAAALMGTEKNIALLSELGIPGSEIPITTPNDLIVAVIAKDQSQVDKLLSEIDQRMHQSTPSSNILKDFPNLEMALESHTDLNIAIISVPGPFAARETKKALQKDLHVFLFSNNVPINEELEIKQIANEKGLLVMGPDCGTSILSGIGIGFANVVRKGPIGVVGSSGTGIQEITSLIHQSGSGVSQAIGTGSHDLTDAIGGITTLMGIDVLDNDTQTKVIVIVSKPAGPETLKKILGRLASCTRPTVACFLGWENPEALQYKNVNIVRTLDDAVVKALSLGKQTTKLVALEESNKENLIKTETSKWNTGQRYLRGLFAGGTFCYQSQQILRDAGILAYSNAPLDKRYLISEPDNSIENSLIDLGDDYFTQGKPHPMIDSTQRAKRILKEANDPEVAILLLDFILGYVSTPTPVQDLQKAILGAREVSQSQGRHITIIANVCGTDLDFQNLENQKKLLTDMGVIVFSSNAQAVQFAKDCLGDKR